MAGFVFYEDYYKIGKMLPTDSEKVLFYEAIFERGLSGKPLENTGDPVRDTAYVFIESLIKANEKRRADGKKGGRPKGSKNKKPVVSLKDNVNDNWNANDNANINNIICDNENTSSGMAPIEGGQPSDDKYPWEE